MQTPYVTLHIGREFNTVIDYEKSKLALNAGNPLHQRNIRSLTALSSAHCEVLLCGLTGQFVRVYPNSVNYRGVTKQGVVAEYSVEPLLMFTRATDVNIALATPATYVVPWQRETVRKYQLELTGREAT